VEGAGDIDDGEAVQSTTVTVIDEEEAAISLNEDSVTKGEKVTFTVTGVQEESLVTVGIEVSDVSGYTAGGGSLAPDDVFRNVGDVSNTSSTNGDSITVSNTDYVVADYEIDGGQAVGSIDTSNLDSDDIDVYVWPDSATNVGDADEDDFTTLTVASATVTLDAIEGPYVIGSSIDISGSVSPNVDSVYVYARGSGDWEPVGSTDSADAYEITVDADNTFSESDFVLTAGTGGGNDLLSIPGNYRLGVADAADISDQSADLTTTLFNDNTTDQVSIVTTTGQLEADVTLYNGQIDNSHRELDIDGVDLQSAGDLVEVVFIGPRGTVENTTISVDDDGTFDSECTSSPRAAMAASAARSTSAASPARRPRPVPRCSIRPSTPPPPMTRSSPRRSG
jgi:major cell surface glycoprotein (TIGR04216 family)